MKRLIAIIVFITTILSISYAQKVVEKKIDVNRQSAEMDLKFADKIEIEAWSKNYIEILVEVDIDDNKYNEHYSLKVENNNTIIRIEEKVDFDAIEEKKRNSTKNHFNTDINYSIKVPKNLNFQLETISGNVELIGCLGKMDINSVSGYIDYAVSNNHNASIKLSTVTGDVYSNIDFNDDKKNSKKVSWVTTKRRLTLNNGNVPVKLETVSGNIFLRKQ